MDIHVDNLGESVTADSLDAVFATYGKVDASTIYVSTSTEEKRTAIVMMPNEKEATMAIEQLHGRFVDGYTLCVMPAQPKAHATFGAFYKRIRNYFL